MTPKEEALDLFEKYLTPNLVSPMYGVLSYQEAKTLIAAKYELKNKNMQKVIIKNESDLLIIDAMRLVEGVIKNGRISNNNKQYCYLSVYEIDGSEYHVTARSNKDSDTFLIYKSKKPFFE